MSTQQQNKNGKWVEATPLPYYPSTIEKIKHFFGVHTYPYRGKRVCLICKIKDSND